MTDTNFKDLLNVKGADAKPLPAVPPGTYTTQVLENIESGRSQQKGTPFIKYSLLLLSPGEDVDLDAIEGGAEGLAGRKLSLTFWFPIDESTGMARADMVAQLKEFIQHCGVEVDDDKPVGEYVAEVVGQEVNISVVNKPHPQNSERILTEISGTAPAE